MFESGSMSDTPHNSILHTLISSSLLLTPGSTIGLKYFMASWVYKVLWHNMKPIKPETPEANTFSFLLNIQEGND
jgi:hypothetical protein